MNPKSEWKEKIFFDSITVPDESWNKNYPVLNDRQGLSKIRWNFLTVDLNQTVFLFFNFVNLLKTCVRWTAFAKSSSALSTDHKECSRTFLCAKICDDVFL